MFTDNYHWVIHAGCHGITELEMLEISFIRKVKTGLGFERCIEVCSKKKRGRKVFRQRKEPWKGMDLKIHAASEKQRGI